jgi:acetyl-CoA/propionyl-CoA carboxylase biotin carboxyl carrier protein
VEARVYAEDPRRGFLPASGTVLRLKEPTGLPHVRVDSALGPGTVIGTDYDPMLAKVVAWGHDRPAALARLRGALAATEVLGVTTNIGFVRRLIEDPDVVAGRLDTELVERLAPALVGAPAPAAVVTAATLLARLLAEPSGPVVDPWDIPDGWRVGPRSEQSIRWQVAGQVTEALDGDGKGDGRARGRLDGADVVIETDSTSTRYGWAADGDTLWLGRDGDAWALTRLRETIDRTGPASRAAGPLTSPMPGTVLAVHVISGQSVGAGQPIVTVEAMKMEHVVVAPVDGTVSDVLVKAGESVRLDQAVAVVTAAEAHTPDVQTPDIQTPDIQPPDILTPEIGSSR